MGLADKLAVYLTAIINTLVAEGIAAGPRPHFDGDTVLIWTVTLRQEVGFSAPWAPTQTVATVWRMSSKKGRLEKVQEGCMARGQEWAVDPWQEAMRLMDEEKENWHPYQPASRLVQRLVSIQ